MSDVDEIVGIEDNIVVIDRRSTVFEEEIQRRITCSRRRRIRSSTERFVPLSDGSDDDASVADFPSVSSTSSKLECIPIARLSESENEVAKMIAFSHGTTRLTSLYPDCQLNPVLHPQGTVEEDEGEEIDTSDCDVDLPDDTPSWTEEKALTNRSGVADGSTLLRKFVVVSSPSVKLSGDEGKTESPVGAVSEESWTLIAQHFEASWFRVQQQKNSTCCWMRIPRSKYLFLVVDQGVEDVRNSGEFSISWNPDGKSSIQDETICWKLLVCPK